MDVLLLAATGGLMTCLPRRIILVPEELNPPRNTSAAVHEKNINSGNNSHKVTSSTGSGSSRYNTRRVSRRGLILTTISLGLSLTLFALSIVELLPASWLWLLSTDDAINDPESDVDDAAAKQRATTAASTTSLTVADVYCLVLWTMALLCTVMIPSTVGTRLCLLLAQRSLSSSSSTYSNSSTGLDSGNAPNSSSNSSNTSPTAAMKRMDSEDDKKRTFTANQDRHWSFRLFYKSFSWMGHLACQGLSCLLAPISRRAQGCCHQLRENMTLPLFSSAGGEQRFVWFLSPANVLLFRFLHDPTYRRCVLVGSLAGTFATCVLLAAVSPLVIEPSTDTTLTEELLSNQYMLLVRVVSWLCSVGILISTALNGFGCIMLPYSCLAGLFLEPVPRDCVVNAETDLAKARETLKEKIKVMESGFIVPSVQMGATAGLPQKSSSFQRFLWKKTSRNLNDIGDEVSRRKKRLRTEIDFLEALIDEMSEDVQEMKASQALSTEARSSAGRIRSWIGIVCSVLLLVRLAWAMSSVWNQYALGITMYRTAEVDPVTQIVMWLSGHNVVQATDLHTLSQFTSLVITAFLSVSQVRTFFRTCDTVQRRMANFYRKCYCKPKCRSSGRFDDDFHPETEEEATASSSHNTWFFSQLVSVLMCCYCLACIVLTKMMLPFEYRISFSRALNVGLDENDLFKIRTFAIDVTFSLTAVLTGAVLAMILGIMRSNARRYRSTDGVVGSSMKNPPSQVMTEP